MRSNSVSLVAIGFLSIAVLHDSAAKDPPRRAPAPAKDVGATEQDAGCSTLSELGVDFGASELERFQELGLSDMQKKHALAVLRDRKAKIELLCERMTKALSMDEGSVEAKKKKEVELAELVGEFKLVQQQIMTGLHAILTDDQMAQLVALKERERVEAAKEEAAKAKREKQAAG